MKKLGDKDYEVTLTVAGKDVTKRVNTILVAIGRDPATSVLNLEDIGVKLDPNSKKVLPGSEEEPEVTNISNIYACGDVLEGVPELMPIA